MNFRNMRIGTRLAAAFTVMLGLAAVLTAMGISRLHQVNEATKEMDAAAYKIRLSEQWHGITATNNSLTEARLRAMDATDDAEIAARMKANSADISKIQDILEPLLQTEQGKLLFETTGVKRKEYTTIRAEIFELKKDPTSDAATIKAMIDGKLMPAMNAYKQSVADVINWQEKLLRDAKQRVDSTVASGKLFLAICGSIAVVLGIILSLLLTRSITLPLHGAVKVARKVADGDLTVDVDVSSTDETGQLLSALKDMTANLNQIVGSVRASSDTIAAASTEVASGNLDLSSRTEQQASSIEETAASIEELSTTVQNNAENARQGNVVAVSASEIATKGGEVVAQVVDTMGQINESAKRIVDIISVIDGIAFQTNILALNAAVEAARAGEQGRGFAVVANEVRTLAHRSAAAAKEIKALIDDSVDKVDAGSRLVNQAGMTIGEVVQSVKRVTDIMSEIAMASQEQSEGILQVNDAIRQMDQVTQQNAALVEEAAAATESMQDQAQQLAQAVSVFKLARHASQHAPGITALRTATGPSVAKPKRPALTNAPTRMAAAR